MKNNPVGWFEIYVQDMNRAKAFYETVLATKLEKLPAPELEMWAFGMDQTSYGAPGALGFSGGRAGVASSSAVETPFQCKIRIQSISSLVVGGF